VVGVSLIVLIVAQNSSPPLMASFERAARGALGADSDVQLMTIESDPSDEESSARAAAQHVDGVIELSWPSVDQARLHCYVARDNRWVDREITFGKNDGDSTRELAERGRLLAFAVATLFTEEPPPASTQGQEPYPLRRAQRTHLPASRPPQRHPPRDASTRLVEFAGVVTSGVDGTASGVGASAALRLVWRGSTSARLFLSGRSGSVPEALATTRMVLGGVGLAFSALPTDSTLQLGGRVDAFVSYFSATHLSEDDIVPDTQSRWLPGVALLGEAGLRLARDAGVFLGVGVELVAGRTDMYTHGMRVATVPPLRSVGELGFRVSF
jgi:hypothetical protein